MSAAMRPGRPWPLGSHWDGHGVNFALFSAHAQRVELCLFDADGRRELQRLNLPAHRHDVWHGYLPDAAPGQVYGFRVHGPWRPERGHRFNPHKLLLDPYAREIVGRFEWRPEHFGADPQHLRHQDVHDNAATALKARVVAELPTDGPTHHLYTPLEDTVLYELHVRGFTKRHPGVPEPLRGTYAGLASEASIAHLQRLGVTAVNLLPVHYKLDEQRLAAMGLRNYWGYNTLGFFCPDPQLAATPDARGEFRAMVRRLHEAGLEVILDVVYNHSAETDERGPTLSFRGIDNASYYRLLPERQHYDNLTGCGNALDLRQPRVLQLVLDSLRYWAGTMGVDGFRFDLAPVLGRLDHGFDRHAPFFQAIAQDPLLSRLKMIAEPWDIGPGGYQLGGFPPGWLEWNDRFRDAQRAFWVEGGRTRGEFALRLCGSSDVYQAKGRIPLESVNYVVSHDGFTLRDLVSYAERHNEANGEHNRDGHGHNHSANFGIEGPTDDPAVRRTRGHVQRALLASALLSQGTPMLAAGDDIGHSQNGNNNPYCQDNETTWLDWSAADDDLAAFTARVLALRRLARPFGSRWYDGLPDHRGLHDLIWFSRDGHELHGADWHDAGQPVLGCLIGKPGRARAPLLLWVNRDAADTEVVLPGGVWEVLLDSSDARGVGRWQGQGPTTLPLPGRCVLLLGAAGHGVELPA